MPTSAAQTCRLNVGDAHEQAPLTVSTATPTSASATASSTAAAVSSTPFDYLSSPVRAVNIGGWLVLEPWITPSFFESLNNESVVDEYTLGQMPDADATQSLIETHWQTWYTEDDFVSIKAAGLTHVRVPLGYWSVPLTSADTNYTTSVAPFIAGAWPYLLKGLNWAKGQGLYTIVDLHGAPGSQNGYDNSGQRTSSPQWALDTVNVNRTLDVLRYVVENAGGLIDVIELLNEIAGYLGDNWATVAREFWQDGYDVVRKAVGSNIKVMIGDAFLGVDSWTDFLTSPSAQGVFMDEHQYQVFSEADLELTWDEHIESTCELNSTYASFDESNLWTIMGEWSTAVTDCAKWLNGRGVGARWDGTYSEGMQALDNCSNYTGSYSGFSADYKTFLRKFWEVQVDVGESINGWGFWAWKVCLAPHTCAFGRLTELDGRRKVRMNGVIPKGLKAVGYPLIPLSGYTKIYAQVDTILPPSIYVTLDTRPLFLSLFLFACHYG
ncbi:glycoside hydrolase [Fistulina hepatica ATCC 64428]|nr:glycoside hydrolase [Fistulina hepatica ATCC 64428]